MKPDELEPLDPAIAALLAGERADDEMPPEAPARLLGRVAATLGTPAGLLEVRADYPSAGAASTATKAAARAKLTHLLAFIVGVGSGVAGYGGYQARQARQAKQTSTAPAVVVPVSSTMEPAPIPSPEQDATPSIPTLAASALPSVPGTTAASTTKTSDGVATTHDHDLAAERAELEVARTALARGQSDAALSALSKHATHFPRGRLEEERESLTIQALAVSGRRAEANQRADAFRKHHPQSLFLPTIDAVLSNAH